MLDSIAPTQKAHRRRVQSSLISSFHFALWGIAYTINSQRNMKIHLALGWLVLLFGLVVPLDFLTRSLLLFCIGLVLFAEVLNTALEAIVDLYSGQILQLAKVAKDCAAGGVLILATTTALVFMSVVYEHWHLVWPIGANFLWAGSLAFLVWAFQIMILFLPQSTDNFLLHGLSCASLLLLVFLFSDLLFGAAAILFIAINFATPILLRHEPIRRPNAA